MNPEETKILNEPAKQEQEQKNEATATKQSDKMKYAGGGFVAGVTTGVATSAGAASLSKDEAVVEEQGVQSTEAVQTEVPTADVEVQQPAPNPEEALIATDEGIRVAQVSDDASFSQAFADARAQVGPGGAFEWHGKVYSTYYEEEWENMSAEERAEYQSKIDYQDIVGEQSVSAESTTGNEPAQEIVAANAEMVDESADIPMEVKVLGVEAVQDAQGNPIHVAAVEVEGQQALLVDVDNDNTMDVIMVDENGDGQIAENEVYDFSDAHVTVEDLQQHMIANQQPEGYLACNDGMPDYMNDADVSSLA